MYTHTLTHTLSLKVLQVHVSSKDNVLPSVWHISHLSLFSFSESDLSICVRVCVYVCMCAYICVCVSISESGLCICVHACVCVYVCICVCVCWYLGLVIFDNLIFSWTLVSFVDSVLPWDLNFWGLDACDVQTRGRHMSSHVAATLSCILLGTTHV